MDVVFKYSSYSFRADGTYFCYNENVHTSWWRWKSGVMEWQHPRSRTHPDPNGWERFEPDVIDGVTEAYSRWVADQIVGTLDSAIEVRGLGVGVP